MRKTEEEREFFEDLDRRLVDGTAMPWDEDFDEEECVVIVSCPQCGHQHYKPDALIGTLGNLSHYRCRSCGWNFAEDSE